MKGWTIKRIDGTDIVEVRHAGEVTYGDRLETLKALEHLQANTPVHRLLINDTSAWPGPTREPRAVSAFVAKLGHGRFACGARVALLNAPADVNAKTANASTRAGYVFHPFDDRECAIAWLMELSATNPQA